MPALTPLGQQIDDAVAVNRAATPAKDVTRRRVPRVSIAELNAMDHEALQDRLHEAIASADNRGPVQTVLDLIDLPRNLMVNAYTSVLAPSIGRKKIAEGEKGTFGIPRVTFSDVLGAMGVEPGVVRGVIGFAGDIATDPLTYIGPAGWGAEVVTKGGLAGIRAGGRRALSAELKAVAEGATTAAKSDTARRLIEASVAKKGVAGADRLANIQRIAAERAARGDTALRDSLQGALRRRTLGSVTNSRVGEGLARVGLNELETAGGTLGRFGESLELADDVGKQQIAAAEDFLSEFGKGTEPGKAFGKDATSQIAHIPFTDVGIRVPGFTMRARNAAANLRLARDARNGINAIDEADPIIREAYQAATNAGRAAESITDAEDPALNAAIAQAGAESVKKALGRIKTDGSPMSARQLMTLGQMSQEADAAARVATAKAKMYQSGLGIRSDLAKKFDDVEVGAQTLSDTQRELFDLANADPVKAFDSSAAYQAVADAQADLAQALKAPALAAHAADDRVLREVAKKALRTSDDIIGTAPFMSASRAAAQVLGDESNTVRQLQVADRYFRRSFGSKSGLQSAQQKYWKNALLSTNIAGEYAHRLQVGLADALKTAGYEPTAELMDQARTLLSVEMERVRDPIGNIYPTTDWLTGTSSKQSQLLQKALADGLYSTDRGKELQKTIKAIASSEAKNLDALKDAELADDLLGVTMDNYIPLGLTPHGQAELSRVSQIMGEQAADKPRAKERFQLQRMTNQTRYIDSDGVKRRFYEGERVVADAVTDGAWQKWKETQAVADIPKNILAMAQDERGIVDPTRADSLMRVVDDVKSYDELPDELRAQYKMTATSPFELEEQRGKRLFWLTGDSSKPFFDTSWDSVAARRSLAHERATARRSAMQLAQAQGIQIDPKLLAAQAPGTTFKTRGGVVGEVVNVKTAQGTTKSGIRVGDTVLRQLDHNAITGSIFQDMIGRDLNSYLLPEQTADMIEGVMSVGKGDTGQLLKLFDQMTGLWRTATLTNPAWITNNLIGNTVLALQQRLITPGDIPAFFKQAAQMHWNRDNPEVLRKIVFDIGGDKINGEQLWNELNRHRIVKNNLLDSTMQSLAGADILPTARPWEQKIRDSIKHFPQDASVPYLSADWRFRMQTLADARTGETNALEKGVDATRAGLGVAGDRYMKWVGAPFARLNTGADDVMRTVAYLSMRNRGFDGPNAAAKVLDGFIDYSDMTRFDSDVMRRIVPFWAWIKNNTAIQVKSLFENPKWAAVAPKLQDALEDAFAGEQAVPENLRPRWMQDSLAVQIGTDPDTRKALLAMSGMPQEQLYRLLQGFTGAEGFQSMVKYFGNSTHPAFQTFAGITSGTDLFSGKTIGPTGDMTLKQFLAKQLRPLSELGIGTGDQGALGNAYEKGGVTGLTTRFLLGGKVQDFSQSRLDSWNLRDAKKAETALRIKISRAETRGEDSLELRTQLLALYDQMLKQGLAGAVPKWAQEELAAPTAP